MKLLSSIRVKLILYFILITIISISSVGVLSYYHAKKIMKDELGHKVALVAKESMKQLDRTLNDRVNEVSDMANSPFVKKYFTPLDAKDLKNKKSSIKTEFKKYQQKGLFVDFVLVDLEGSPLEFSSKPINSPKEQEWFHKATTESLYIGNIQYDESGKHLVYPIASLVTTLKGDKVGVLLGYANYQPILQEINTISANAGNNSIIRVINKDGYLIADTSSKHAKDSILKENVIEKGLAVYDELAAAKPGYNNYLTSKDASGNELSFGIVKSAGYNSFKGLGWGLALGQPTDTVLAPLQDIRTLILLSGVVILLIASTIAVILATNITKPILKVAAAADKVAKGDFSHTLEIKEKGEIGRMAQAINEMIYSFRSIALQVSESAKSLAASSYQIKEGSEQISYQSVEQASNTQTITNTMQQVSSASQQVAKSSENLANYSNEAIARAKHGTYVVEKTIDGMNVVNDKTQELGSRIKQIDEIVNLINEIAEQTNLLALNAAIEAARAGEHGKGFAVVADEVRQLAERSKESVKEISNLIKTINSDTTNTIKAVDDGMIYAKETGEALDAIKNIIEQMGDMIQDVAAASQEQSASTDEVLGNIESIARSLKETVAGLEETATTVQDLSKMAADLDQLMKKFKVS